MLYYTKVLMMWDDLLSLSPFQSCGCKQSDLQFPWYENLHTYQFLMALDEKYGILLTQIINMEPLPNVDWAYAMVVQEESH